MPRLLCLRQPCDLDFEAAVGRLFSWPGGVFPDHERGRRQGDANRTMAARKKDIEDHLVPLAEELAGSLGLEVYDLVLRPSGPRWKLTVFLEGTGGPVTLDDCTRFSRQFSRELDVLDPIPHAYDLEVSSPGMERVLRHPRHFQRALGEQVSVRWRGEDGRVHSTVGTLVVLEKDRIRVRPAGTDEAVAIPLAALVGARIHVDW